MFHYKYQTKNVCSQLIELDMDGDTVTNVVFRGGCEGNLKAIGKLVKGMKADQIIKLLKGNPCGNRETSCADQLCKAVQEACRIQKIPTL